MGAALSAQPSEQTFKAPPEVEQALRARVTKFFQLHVDGNFQEAWGMVAENTKNYYFKALKNPLSGFKVNQISFQNAEFTKATVNVTVDQVLERPEFPNTVIPVPKETLWKIEKGEWMWYVDDSGNHRLPMGTSDMASIKAGQQLPPSQLQSLSDPDKLLKLGQQVIAQQPSGFDKQEVTLAADKESSVEVKFHNGQPGWVDLSVGTGAPLPGLTATLDKRQVAANSDAVIKLTYTPPEGAATPPPHMVMLSIEPLRQMLPIRVTFEKSAK